MRTVILIYACIVCSCTDREASIATSYIENNSGHLVAFKFYKQGIEDQSEAKQFSIGERSVVYFADERPAGSYATHFGDTYDSLVVSFDNSKASVHYYYHVAGNNSDAILYESSRNVFNEKSYENKILKDTRNHFEQQFTYVITEQDYLNAK